MEKQSNLRRYLFEFLSIFLGVSLAFALNKWNENSIRFKSSEKTLLEIRNGLELDMEDFQGNRQGHEIAIQSCQYFRKYIKQEDVTGDSVVFYYRTLLRDYISIQNKSGYESLKATGLDLVEDDSLRLQIISLYDYYYEIIEKMEEEYSENQFHENYFAPINSTLTEYMKFDERGNLVYLHPPSDITDNERNSLLSYLWKIQLNREFTMKNYLLVEEKVSDLISHIDETIE